MDVTAWIDGLLEAVQSVDPVWRILLAGFAVLLETSVLLGLVVPGDSVVLLAAVGTEDATQWALLVVACLVGALCGESIGFAIGRALGPAIDRMLARRWPAAARQWSKVEVYLRRRGGIAILLSRFLPVAHSLVPLIVGTSGMRYARFIAWTAPACLLWALLYATIGWRTAASYAEIADTVHGAGYLFVGAIVLFLVVVWLGKRWLLHREVRHMRDERADATSDEADAS